MVSLRPVVSALSLLAVLPVAAFLVGRSESIVALSALNVVLIAGSLYAMFGPSETATAAHAP